MSHRRRLQFCRGQHLASDWTTRFPANAAQGLWQLELPCLVMLTLPSSTNVKQSWRRDPVSNCNEKVMVTMRRPREGVHSSVCMRLTLPLPTPSPTASQLPVNSHARPSYRELLLKYGSAQTTSVSTLSRHTSHFLDLMLHSLCLLLRGNV